MNQVSTVGLDLAKHIFQLHGADSAGAVVFRKKLRRGQVLSFLATLPPCTVAMEACGSAHYWGREIAKLGHTVRLISPAYVKPFVKRQKNDAADAEAICEAARRGAGLGVPGRDRRLREPHRQAPARRKAASYSAQFVTRRRCFGIWWRRAA